MTQFLEALAMGDVFQSINQSAHDLAKEISKTTKKKHPSSLVKEHKKSITAIKKVLKTSYVDYHGRMKHGMDLLVHSGLLAQIDVSKFFESVSKKSAPELSDTLFQHKIGISDDTILSFYECGTHFFDINDFVSAGDIFLVLTFLNPFVPSFWVGLGMSEEMRHEFDGAALAFLMAAELQENGYAWAIRAAECYNKANKPEQARAVLDVVINETSKHPKHAELKNQALTVKKCMSSR